MRTKPIESYAARMVNGGTEVDLRFDGLKGLCNGPGASQTWGMDWFTRFLTDWAEHPLEGVAPGRTFYRVHVIYRDFVSYGVGGGDATAEFSFGDCGLFRVDEGHPYRMATTATRQDDPRRAVEDEAPQEVTMEELYRRAAGPTGPFEELFDPNRPRRPYGSYPPGWALAQLEPNPALARPRVLAHVGDTDRRPTSERGASPGPADLGLTMEELYRRAGQKVRPIQHLIERSRLQSRGSYPPGWVLAQLGPNPAHTPPRVLAQVDDSEYRPNSEGGVSPGPVDFRSTRREEA